MHLLAVGYTGERERERGAGGGGGEERRGRESQGRRLYVDLKPQPFSSDMQRPPYPRHKIVQTHIKFSSNYY